MGLASIATILSAAATGYSVYSGARESSKARSEQKALMMQAEKSAVIEKERLENIDIERKERLRLRGTQLPPSLLTGLSGVSGKPSVLKKTLG